MPCPWGSLKIPLIISKCLPMVYAFCWSSQGPCCWRKIRRDIFFFRCFLFPVETQKGGVTTSKPIGSMGLEYLPIYIYHRFMPNVGKYTSPMDPMGSIPHPYFLRLVSKTTVLFFWGAFWTCQVTTCQMRISPEYNCSALTWM